MRLIIFLLICSQLEGINRIMALSDIYGFYSGIWRKLGIIPSISGQVAEEVSNLNAAAGTNILSSSAVPADRIWFISTISAFNSNTNPSFISLFALAGGVTVRLATALAPGSSTPVLYGLPIVLFTGDSLRANIGGCTLNDDIFLDFFGYYLELSH